MKPYYDLRNQYTQELAVIKSQYNTISTLRLLSVLLFFGSLYFGFRSGEDIWFFAAFISLGGFFVFMQKHTELLSNKQLKEALVSINSDEIDYLDGKKIPFANGEEHINHHHPYAYDLDVFGNKSLFHHLNRTTTFIGSQTFAKQLLRLLPNKSIEQNQKAVQELAFKLDWRQQFMALGKISFDNRQLFSALMRWSKSPSAPISSQIRLLSYVLPIAQTGTLLVYVFYPNLVLISVASTLFVFNLALFGQFYKRISIEIQNAENIDKIIKQYGLLVAKIETETFDSERLKMLQSELRHDNRQASFHLKTLSSLFGKMETISNFVVAFLFNGFFLYHIHILNSLIRWKQEHANNLENWLNVIGEIEMLNSLANFSYNNPQFVFPSINENFEVRFTELSHPLIRESVRIGNNVNFQPQSFMVLTGSNMSGKSTFLRSLGVNMILTGIGAPVCAREATVHPMPVLVSMRLSDSLSDSESYFYAEIKRLKLIMDELNGQRAFVLLDEILRGTNSDDKRSGTIGVVKKMIASKAIGAIATHDIEVCATTNEFPETLTNKCFEAEIVDGDLHFDYKLREGICKNKSATFLMKKMEII